MTRNRLALAGILVVCAGAIGSQAEVFGLRWRAPLPEDAVETPLDLATYFDERYAPLRAALPPRGHVAFRSDDRWGEGHMQLQYALVPRVVVDGTSEAGVPLVVDAMAVPPETLAPDPSRWELRRDFGDGLRLYREKTR